MHPCKDRYALINSLDLGLQTALVQKTSRPQDEVTHVDAKHHMLLLLELVHQCPRKGSTARCREQESGELCLVE